MGAHCLAINLCDKNTAMYFYVIVNLTVVNGVSLKPIKLKEAVFDGHIAHKVKCFHGPHGTDPILFLWQVPRLRSP